MQDEKLEIPIPYRATVYLDDWIEGDDFSNTHHIPEPEPIVPVMWNTREFYKTAVALGLDNEETIVSVMAAMSYFEQLMKYTPNNPDDISKFVLNAILKGEVPPKHTSRAYRMVRRVVWGWRFALWRERLYEALLGQLKIGR